MKLLFWLLLSTNCYSDTLPERIVVLNPALTEIIFALGEGKRIVGTTEFADYPEDAKQIPRVGGYLNPSLEKIIALKPRAVLVAEEGVDTVSEQVKRAGLRVSTYKIKMLSDFEIVVKKLGHELNAETKARETLEKWNREWSVLHVQKSQQRVAIQVDFEPTFVAGSETFLSEIVERCGATNEFAQIKGFKQPTLERLAQSKADVILVTAQTTHATFKKNVISFWAKQPRKPIPRILFFDPDLLSRLSPRLPAAALSLCRELRK